LDHKEAFQYWASTTTFQQLLRYNTVLGVDNKEATLKDLLLD